MYDNLVTYHLHRHTLPAQDTPASATRVAPVYQYILAGNGVQVRAETRFFTARLRIAPGVVRGLPPLQPQFRLKVPRLPAGRRPTPPRLPGGHRHGGRFFVPRLTERGEFRLLVNKVLLCHVSRVRTDTWNNE